MINLDDVARFYDQLNLRLDVTGEASEFRIWS